MSMNVSMMTCTPVSKCVTLMDHTAVYALMAINLALVDSYVMVRNIIHAYFQLAVT